MSISFTAAAAVRAWQRCMMLLALMIAGAVNASAQETSQASTTAMPAPQVSASPSPTPTPTPSSAPTPSPTPSLERQFFRNILRDQRAIFTSPLGLRARDARWLAPLGASTAALIATDRRTAGELGDGKDRLEVSRGVSEVGAFYTASGVAATFYFVGRATNNRRMRETGLLGAEALIDGVIVSTALKAITQRPRPREGGGRGRFFTGGNSFPSGHAVTAWSLATVIAYEYKDRPLVRFGAYGVAAAVSVSRFGGRNHFLSDVLVGSAIGYGIGRYVYRTRHVESTETGEAEDAGRRGSRLSPMFAPSYNRRARAYGVSLAWSF